MRERTYVAIDLKSFYASVECVQRGLDPLTTNLVVADRSRSDKTICLAVSPSLKQYGISGRARLFEVVQQVAQANALRRYKAPNRTFSGSSWDDTQLKARPELEIDYIAAPPRMALYMEMSAKIYGIYLKYVAPEDIHVYSIDEVFMDVTNYLGANQLTPREFVMKIILDILNTTGITATAGIGTNLYLCKVAMDIVAKRIPADRNGVRIACLDEKEYRKIIWGHRPITDIWRVGRGYAKKLERYGMYTMGDVARRSTWDENLFYKLFGVNAELLIDHAWGWEPCTMTDIKAYRPESSSIGSGQVLHRPYTAQKAKLIVREMADILALDLVAKNLVTDQIVLTLGYDIENLSDPERSRSYKGAVITDHYGRTIPRHAHSRTSLERHTSSSREILQAVSELYDRIVDETLLIRRVNLVANHVIDASSVTAQPEGEQLDLFVNYEEEACRRAEHAAALEREKRQQRVILSIKKRFGKNAILKGTNLEEGATARSRNMQIGGHKA